MMKDFVAGMFAVAAISLAVEIATNPDLPYKLIAVVVMSMLGGITAVLWKD